MWKYSKENDLPIAVVDRIVAVDFDCGIVRVERFSVLFLLDEFVAFVLQLIGLLPHIIGQRYTHRLWVEETGSFGEPDERRVSLTAGSLAPIHEENDTLWGAAVAPDALDTSERRSIVEPKAAGFCGFARETSNAVSRH